MKKSRSGLIFLASILTFGGIGLSNALKNNNNLKVKAAIDIEDYTACNTAYNNHNASGLLSALRTITSPGHSGSYDGLYETYKVAYLKPNGRIFDYYSSITNYDPDKDRAGSYKKEGDCFNREHSIPQSWWGGGTGNQGSDPYIVVPTDGYVNNARGNNPFGMVGTAQKTFSNSKSGSAASGWGYSGTVFEPDDSVKGDFARIYFYAIAKYSNAPKWSGGNASSCFSGSESNQFGLTNYAIKLFSYWSELDPVSEWEMNANNAIAPIQGNRNPFIDHPEYANVLWGSNSGYTPYTHGVPSADGISISKTEDFLIANNTTTISATSTDSSQITWSTSNAGIVSLSSSKSASGASITLTGRSAGTATITASATINGETYSKTCSIEVAATKQVVSIVLSGQKLSYKVDDAFVKPTVTAAYNDSTQSVVASSEVTCIGYDMSTAGNYTVTVSYSFGGATATATYDIRVKESGGGESGEEISLDIDFTNNKTSDTDSQGNVWAASGDFTGGSSYLRLNSSGSYISNNHALSVDTDKTMTIKATLRTYGGDGNQSLNFTAYNENNEAVSNTLSLKPSSKSLFEYSGDLTFTSSNDHEITLKAVFSANSRALGISGMSVSYTSWIDSPKTLVDIGVKTSPRVDYYVGNYFDPDGLVITREYDDGSSDTYAYSGHENEFSFDPSPVTPLTVDYEDVEIVYGGQSCYLPIEVNIPKELTSITISGYRTSFVEGDTFEFGGTVTAHYQDLSTEDVTSKASFTGYDLTVVGTQTVIVNYSGVTKDYDVTVSAGTLTNIAVTGMTTTYVKNASFNFDGTCTAVFANGYQKVVTPTSVSTPDMSTTGVKEITVTYSYNGKTKTTTYDITVNSYRNVYEEVESVIGSVTYPNNVKTIDPKGSLTTSDGGYTAIESNAIRLGSGSNTGSVTVTSSTSNIYRIVVSAKTYGSDSGVKLTIGGTSNTITSSYVDYEKKYSEPTNSVQIATTANKKRAYVQSITVYTKTEENIGQTEDCIGLETFITNYMHMDYVDNLGYCKDSEHHYYSTAKAAFNALNEHQRSLFTGNSAYSAEWSRLQAWAHFNGDDLNEKTITLEANKYLDNSDLSNDNNIIIITVITAMSSIILFSVLLILKKRKKR